METVCGICGDSHSSYSCDKIIYKKHVNDNPLPSKARLTIPPNFSLRTMSDGTFELEALEKIEKGTFFGPLEAPKLLSLNPAISFPLKLFSKEIEDLQESYLDTTDENVCNWLIFLSPASCIEEQNVICFQEKSNIIYATIKDIEKGEVLKVWYSPYYAKMMKSSLLSTNEISEFVTRNDLSIDLNTLLIQQQNITARKIWTCKFCSKLENDVTVFANHILDHYTKKLRKICEICQEAFSTKLNLRKHMKTVHANDLKVKKTRSKQMPDKHGTKFPGLFGGPLLNNLLNDSLDATNLLMPSVELSSFDLNSSCPNVLLENDCLSGTNLLNENEKELNDFHFEINEQQEQNICDICLKPFSKLKLLVQHLRKHTGKFVCSHCSRAFSRNENLLSHDCNESKTLKFSCESCDKVYALKKYLQRHMKAAHGKKVTCTSCQKVFSHPGTLKIHDCSAIPLEEKIKYTCPVCQKVFSKQSNFKNHMKLHSRCSEPSKKKVCETCGDAFISRNGFLNHLRSHGEPRFNCPYCDKKFKRKDVLRNHLTRHEQNKTFTCEYCKKTFKAEKYLKSHLYQHKRQPKPFKCLDCDAQFDKAICLKRHKQRHKNICQECKKQFTNFEELKRHFFVHAPNFYLCPFCDTIVKLKGSLIRHMKNIHVDQTNEFDFNTLKGYKSVSNESEEEKSVRNLLKSIVGENSLQETITLYSNQGSAKLSSEYDVNFMENRTESSTDNNLDDIVRNLENVVDIYNANKNSYDTLNSQQMSQDKNTTDTLIDLHDLDISMDSNINLQQSVDFEHLQTHNICLSMPELNESNLTPTID